MIVTDGFIKQVSADAFTIFQGMNCPESVLSYNRDDELPEIKACWNEMEEAVKASANDVLDKINEYAGAMGRQYFMYGFEYALRMMEGGKTE